MSADERSVQSSLTAAQHAQIDQVCTAFEGAWRRGQTPDLEDGLRGFDAPQPVRERLFAELLALEVHYRRSGHQTPSPADYQARFPEYGEQIRRVFQKPPTSSKIALQSPAPPAPPRASQDTLSRADPAASSDPRKQPGGTRSPSPKDLKRLGRYEVLRELGRGAFGCVYLGRDPQLDRQVAIKVARRDLFASEDSAARFLSEARKAAQVCKHPGIVTLYDVQRQGDTYYLVMDYVEGGTLEDPAATAKLTPAETAELVARVAEAVHFAHTHGVVHCDLKPANILMDGNGDPKVADFGLAVLESEQSHRKGERSGTPKYMSPEQVQGHVERLDGRTDIWSLGATLYELLTRRPPFSGETRAELFDQILHRDVKPPRQINDKIPAALERICLKALSKQPADRYSTARDLARDLRQAIQPPSLQRLRQLAWLLSGLVLVLIGVLVVVSLRSSPRGKEVTGTSTPRSGPEVPKPQPEPKFEPPSEPEPPPSPKLKFSLAGKHTRPITNLAGSSRYAVSLDETGAVWLWDLGQEPAVGRRVAASGTIWRVGLSGDERWLATLYANSPDVGLQSIPDLAPTEPWLYTGLPPEILLTVANAGSVWAVVPLENRLQVLEFPGGVDKGSCSVTGSWSCLTGARVEEFLVFAGFDAKAEKWRVVKWKPGESSTDESSISISGAVYSLAISKQGTVAVGGYGPDVGVQLCLPEKQPLPLAEAPQDGRLCYHEVAISADEKYVFAIGRDVPPRGNLKQEHAVLRVWPLSPKTLLEQPCIRIDIPRPVDAVVFLSEQQLFLLASGNTVEVWSLK